MTSSAIAAKGVTLTRDGHLIAEVNDFGAVGFSVDKIEVTNHDSPNNAREYIPGMIEGGEMSIKGNFIAGDTAGQIGLKDDGLAGTVHTYVLTFPTAITATWTFSGFVTSFETGGLAANGKPEFTAKIKVTGKPVLAIAESTGLTTPFMSFDAGTLVPDAAGNVYEYVLDEGAAVGTVVITPTAAAGVITITNMEDGTSQTVTTGEASSAITLGAAGSRTDIEIKVQETGKVAKRYTISVARAAT